MLCDEHSHLMCYIMYNVHDMKCKVPHSHVGEVCGEVCRYSADLGIAV